MKTVKAVSLPLRSCSLWSGAGLALVNFNSIDWTAKSLKVRLRVLTEEIRGGTCFIHSIQGDAYCQKSFIFYFSHEWFMSQLLCAVAPFRGSAIRGLYVFPLAQWLVYTSLLGGWVHFSDILEKCQVNRALTFQFTWKGNYLTINVKPPKIYTYKMQQGSIH